MSDGDYCRFCGDPALIRRIEDKDEQLKMLRLKCDALMTFLDQMKPQLTGKDQRTATELIEREDARWPRRGDLPKENDNG